MYIFINKKSPAKGIRPNGVPRPLAGWVTSIAILVGVKLSAGLGSLRLRQRRNVFFGEFRFRLFETKIEVGVTVAGERIAVEA